MEIPQTYSELLTKYNELLLELSALRLQLTTPTQQSITATETTPSQAHLILGPTFLEDQDSTIAVLDEDTLSLSSNPQQQPQPHPHPLLLETIVRHLGLFLSHSSLRNGRLVSVRWYLYLTPSFLKKSKLVARFCRDANTDNAVALTSSDSEDDLDGWRTMKNFCSVYPFPIPTPAPASSEDGEEEDEDVEEITTTSTVQLPLPAPPPPPQSELLEREPARPVLLPPKDTRTYQQLRAFYWESKRGRNSSSSNSGPGAATTAKNFHNSTDFDLGFDLGEELYIPPPPVPETLELVGTSCPVGWLQIYGFMIKSLSLDFGNFQRRERYGECDPEFVVKLLRDYCPRVESLKLLKPNYANGDGGMTSFPLQGPPPLPRVNNPMSTAIFENIRVLNIHTYRSDKVQCVKEFLAAVPNIRQLSLSMYSVPPDVETQYLEVLCETDCLKQLESLKFPMGIKSTSLGILVGVEFYRLKQLGLGRIRQSRWIRDANNPRGQVVPFVDPILLPEFLQNVSGTIEDLTLSVNLTHPDEIWIPLTPTDIPVLPFLTRFDYKYVRPEFTESFQFLENLPSLVELVLTSEGQNDELISRKLLPETFATIVESLRILTLNNFTVEFPSVCKIVRYFPRLKVLQVQLPLGAGDPGNSNVRRPLSRYLFKLRKLSGLEELRIKCAVVERDDFSYSVGFCLRYMRALKTFAFKSLKTVPRLSLFAVEMGFMKAVSLTTVELEDFLIYEDDRNAIEAALRKKLLSTKFINCFIVNPLKEKGKGEKMGQSRTTASVYGRMEYGDKWSYEVDKYAEVEGLFQPRESEQRELLSSLSFASSDTESLEFAIASL